MLWLAIFLWSLAVGRAQQDCSVFGGQNYAAVNSYVLFSAAVSCNISNIDITDSFLMQDVIDFRYLPFRVSSSSPSTPLLSSARGAFGVYSNASLTLSNINLFGKKASPK
jgi:hypothetical protein